MNTTISPVFFKDMETEGYLDSLTTRMKDSLGNAIMSQPFIKTVPCIPGYN